MAIRYRVERGDDFPNIKVFKVREPLNDHGFGRTCQVWIDENGRGRCCVCDSPLCGMSTSCRHVQAVKRFIKRLTEAEPKH
jgi:hypothetical protein